MNDGSSTAPPFASLMGSGLIPFFVCAGAGHGGVAPWAGLALVLRIYGAVILSFIGAVHWGLAMQGDRPALVHLVGAAGAVRLAAGCLPRRENRASGPDTRLSAVLERRPPRRGGRTASRLVYAAPTHADARRDDGACRRVACPAALPARLTRSVAGAYHDQIADNDQRQSGQGRHRPFIPLVARRNQQGEDREHDRRIGGAAWPIRPTRLR